MSFSMSRTLRAGCVLAIVAAAQLGRAQTPAGPKVPPDPSSGLGSIPPDLGNPSATAGGTIELDPPAEKQLPADQRAAMKLAMKFLKDHGVKAPDGTELHGKVDLWIKKGILTFGAVPDNDNACYGQGELTVNTKFADNIGSKNQSPLDRNVQVVGLAQVLVHEFQHEHQEQGDPKNPREPWSKDCETEAWTAALKETERWVHKATPKSLNNATSKQLDMLQAVTTGWIEYNTFYQNKIDQKIIFDHRTYSDSSGNPISVQDKITQMGDLRRRAGEMRDMLSVLESIAGVKPGTETIDQLIDKIPETVVSRTDLEKYVKGLAEKAVSREHKLSPWQTKKQQLIVNRLLKSYPRIERSWKKRRLPKILREKFAATAAKLASAKLSLSYSPNPAVIDPSQGGDVAVQVAVDSQAVDDVLQELRSIVRTGRGTPAVSIVDAWTELPEGTGGKYVFSEPKQETIELVRTIRVASTGSLYDKLFQKTFTVEGATTVKVEKIEFPRSIAGPWKGSIVILTMPGLDKVRAGAAGGDEFDQACAGILASIARLKGRPMALTTTIVPSHFAAGRMTLSVTPPSGFGSGGEPIPCNYRYVNGVITASGVQDKTTIRLTGRLLPAPGGGWMIEGTWRAISTARNDAAGNEVVTGSWSGSNPNAK
jgi:hypothetical protein